MVCRTLGIPHYVLNVQREFQEHVIDYFCREYSNGRTPHPCIACNDKIKFNFLMNRAVALQAKYVATGHYAQIGHTGDGWVLKKGVDASKDQSYVLFGMGQDDLSRTLMPVGAYTKKAIREMALEAGFINAEKPDSQDICFIPLGDYKAYLKQQVTSIPGEIVDLDGAVLGEHKGIEFFTVGQRRGLGVHSGEPIYVIRIDAEAHRVVVGPEEALYGNRMWTSQVNYTLGTPPSGPIKVTVKIRYKAHEAPAVLYPQGDGAAVCFEEPQRALTPGQAAVFYQDDVLVGGGIIEGDTSSEALWQGGSSNPAKEPISG